MNHSIAGRTTLASLPFLLGTVTKDMTSFMSGWPSPNQEITRRPSNLAAQRPDRPYTMPYRGGMFCAYRLLMILASHAIVIKDWGGMTIQPISKLDIQVLQPSRIIVSPARSSHSMAPQKRHSGQSSGGSSSSSIRCSTPPPSPTKQRSAECYTLRDGTMAYRVPAPHHSHDRTIPFSDGGPGISIKNILNGGSIQDSPKLDFKAGSRKIVLQWPGYDPLDITINSNTKQELAVALCTALHKFYSWASKIQPAVESVPWALFSRVRLGDIMLTSIHWNAGVWVPEFYVLRKS